MTILSRVCAEFRSKTGQVIYRITPRMLCQMLTDVPEAIQEDPLFRMLLNDGSLDAVTSVRQEKALANDPMAGASADGRKPPAAKADMTAASDPPAMVSADSDQEPASPAEDPAPEKAKSPAKTRKAAK